jgi:hypothetical protein
MLTVMIYFQYHLKFHTAVPVLHFVTYMHPGTWTFE